MDQLAQVHEITLIQWLMAYVGSLIYIMKKIQEMNDVGTFQIGVYIKKHWASTISTALMIPVLMLILNENLEEYLPINNLSATLVGYQTNDLFKALIGIGGKRLGITKDTEPVAKGSSNDNPAV